MKNLLVALIIFLSSLSLVAEDNTKPATQGIDHLGLTVSDLSATTSFFIDVLGWRLAGRDKSYPANFVTDGQSFVTLWQVKDKSKLVTFNRKYNVGLHHLAIKVSSFETLDVLYNRMKNRSDVVIEFAPELFYGGPAKHMMIREPSGNRLEFIHRPPKAN
ncbi:VOC family protein [Pleionea sp. CnH1-48]|uniref:VOC family protein n=1 Tax=Pleionea sp. CnH1-48 TaxID=2954494 RepID=UPI00209772EE|nr:VOC family protein [Pleionea sp. CnH1-48]MCO7225604.1 VOC family protein [Pleionea sp. CnH1-48]